MNREVELPDDAQWCEMMDAAAVGDTYETYDATGIDEPVAWTAERDAYTELLELGAPVADPSDAFLAAQIVREFRTAGAPVAEATRTGAARWKWAVAGGLAAVAAAVALLLLPPSASEAPVAVASGEFAAPDLAANYAVGDAVPGDAWLVGERDDACIGHVSARACGVARVRIDATDALDLTFAGGSLTVDGPATIRTDLVTASTEVGKFQIAYADAVGALPITLTVTKGPVTIRTASGTETLEEGDRRVFGESPKTVVAEVTPEPAPEPAMTTGPELPPEGFEPPEEDDVETRPRKESRPKAPKMSAAEMLARARRLKGEKDLKGAERAYKELRKVWPKSPEARASAVSLGQIRLKLGKARGALSAFDAYLSKGGPLEEEARWGKVRALDALHRTAARDAAIDDLFAKHPRTVYRRKAKALQE